MPFLSGAGCRLVSVTFLRLREAQTVAEVRSGVYQGGPNPCMYLARIAQCVVLKGYGLIRPLPTCDASSMAIVAGET